MFVCLSAPRNLRGLKSYDHEIWHVGPLSDRKTLRSIRILIFGRKHVLWGFAPHRDFLVCSKTKSPLRAKGHNHLYYIKTTVRGALNPACKSGPHSPWFAHRPLCRCVTAWLVDCRRWPTGMLGCEKNVGLAKMVGSNKKCIRIQMLQPWNTNISF